MRKHNASFGQYRVARKVKSSQDNPMAATLMTTKRIGLISDTHGLMRPEALDALRNSDLLIHSGDIGKPEVIIALQEIAPLVAIKGNNDRGPWARRLPDTKKIALGNTRLYVIHNVNELDFDPARRGFRVVIAGHSHKPAIHTKDNVLFINPGSAGPRRFKLPICVGRLTIQGESIEAKIIELAI
jgi:putative phosphoesterase